MAGATENGAYLDFLNSLFGLGTECKNRNLEWVSDLPECEIGDFMIVPLTTSWQLRAEGRAMKHCIGQYDVRCHKGLARVFSIQELSGNRVATASLIWRDDYWHLEKVKGYENAEVMENMYTFFNGNSTVTEQDPTELYFVFQ